MTWEEAVVWLRAQPEHRQLAEACFYDDPLLAAARRYRASTEWAAIRRFLPAPGSVLDLGAGRGIASFAFASDRWTVSAVEPDPSAVVGAGAIRALAAEAGLRIDVREEWGERLPFAGGSFDVVFGRAVMHHARDLAALCHEITRVLRPGGIFVGAREHVVSSSDDLPAFLAAHPLHGLYGGENAYRVRDYTGALRSAGLRIVRTLNPLESDVNLFPDSRDALRRRVAARLKIPAALVPGTLLTVAGALRREPGRLYSFVARKPHA